MVRDSWPVVRDSLPIPRSEIRIPHFFYPSSRFRLWILDDWTLPTLHASRLTLHASARAHQLPAGRAHLCNLPGARWNCERTPISERSSVAAGAPAGGSLKAVRRSARRPTATRLHCRGLHTPAQGRAKRRQTRTGATGSSPASANRTQPALADPGAPGPVAPRRQPRRVPLGEQDDKTKP